MSYSIKELEILSGIKAHTIRMWEKRYNLMTPSRTKSNIRDYCEKDLRILLNVVFLKNHGLKISQIAKLDPKEIDERVMELDGKYYGAEIPIEKFLTPIIEMNEPGILHQLNHFIIARGIENTYEEIMKGVYRKIIVLENAGVISKIQSGFFTNLIRRYLHVAIENLPVPKDYGKKILFIIPQYETIDLRLLFLTYVSLKEKHKCFYIGKIHENQISSDIGCSVKPDVIITTFFSINDQNLIEQYLIRLRENMPEAKLMVTGPAIESGSIKLPDNTFYIHTANELKEELKNSNQKIKDLDNIAGT